MALNAITIAAIVAACWAHPSGQAYLAKIDQIEALSIACGNPCCDRGGFTDELIRRVPMNIEPRRRQAIENDEALLLAVLI